MGLSKTEENQSHVMPQYQEKGGPLFLLYLTFKHDTKHDRARVNRHIIIERSNNTRPLTLTEVENL